MKVLLDNGNIKSDMKCDFFFWEECNQLCYRQKWGPLHRDTAGIFVVNMAWTAGLCWFNFMVSS